MVARVSVLLGAFVVALLAGGPDGAAQSVSDRARVAARSLTDQVLTGCEAELRDHCSAVTPGEARLLACLYAHEDKLSGRCELALYDAAVRLERAIGTLTYVASECRADIEARCDGVQAGEGRILQCLEGAGDQLSAECAQALTELGPTR